MRFVEPIGPNRKFGAMGHPSRFLGLCLQWKAREGGEFPGFSFRSYCLTAIAEISIFAPPINPATWTVALAGLGSGMSAL